MDRSTTSPSTAPSTAGTPLVDNCEFSRLRTALGPEQATGALVVAPLPVPGGTGCNVSPVVLL